MDSRTKITYRCGHSTIKTENKMLLSAFFRLTRTGNKENGGLCVKCQPRRRAPPARGTSQTIEAIANGESTSAINKLRVAQDLSLRVANLTKTPKQIVEPSLLDQQITALYELDIERADQIKNPSFELWNSTRKPRTSLLWIPGTQVKERAAATQPSIKPFASKLDKPIFLSADAFPPGMLFWQPLQDPSFNPKAIEPEKLEPGSYDDKQVTNRIRQRMKLPEAATIAVILSQTKIPSTLSAVENMSLAADLDIITRRMEDEIEEVRRKIATTRDAMSARSLNPLSHDEPQDAQDPQYPQDTQEQLEQEIRIAPSFEEQLQQVKQVVPSVQKQAAQYDLIDARSERGQEFVASLRMYLSLPPSVSNREVRMAAKRFLHLPDVSQREPNSKRIPHVVRLLSEDANLRHFQFRSDLNQIRWAREDFLEEVSIREDDDDDSIYEDLNQYTTQLKDREGLKIIEGIVREDEDPSWISGLRNESILENKVAPSSQEELEREEVESDEVWDEVSLEG